MKRINIDKNWYFHLETKDDSPTQFGFKKCSWANGFAAKEYDDINWRKVDLPHDWGVELDRDRLCDGSQGCRPISRHVRPTTNEKMTTDGPEYNIGWYRHEFDMPEENADKRIFLEFDGVARDCIVWVNGIYLDRHTSGYTDFVFDITDAVVFGEKNSIAVRIDASQYEGWWYEGAGIYRHVRLGIADKLHIPYKETAVISNINGDITVNTSVKNEYSADKEFAVTCEIIDKNGKVVATGETTGKATAYGDCPCSIGMHIDSPMLWDIENPNMYKAVLAVKCGGTQVDEDNAKFGIREAVFDPDKGFLLNGKSVKLKGVCVHQDFSGLGSALPDRVHYYKIEKLKEMGVNAYRTSHNPPAPELLDACDELGMVVMNEQRMFGSSPEALRQLTAFVRRDRNHPSVVLWSLGNEEHLVQGTEQGKRIATTMIRTLKDIDATRAITCGCNNGIQYEGINEILDIRGINYIRTFGDGGVDKYHADHPHQTLFGSEESSAFATRGIYETNDAVGMIDSYGNTCAPWGSTPKGWWKFYDERPFMAGGFLWTGFDYRGEPAPFEHMNMSSTFGIIDLCGFPKDAFYYYKSWWTDETVLHLLPYWDWVRSEMVRVSVFTNCDEVEIIVNGCSWGKKTVEKNETLSWDIPYERGYIEAIGTRNGETKVVRYTTPTAPDSLKLSVDRPEISANDDVSIVRVDVADASGQTHPKANNMIYFETEGPGKIIAVGNGDPTSYEPDKFLDKEITTPVENWFIVDGDNKFPIEIEKTTAHNYNEFSEGHACWMEPKNPHFCDDYRMVHRQGGLKSIPTRTFEYEAVFEATEQYKYVEFERLYGECEIFLNGEKIGERRDHFNFAPREHRYQANFKNGTNVIKVVSTAQENKKIGPHESVKIGYAEKASWRRKAFNGLAQVLVQANAPGELIIKAHSPGLKSAEIKVNVK